MDVLWRLSLLSETGGIGENFNVFQWIWLYLDVLRSALGLEEQVPGGPEGSWGALGNFGSLLEGFWRALVRVGGGGWGGSGAGLVLGSIWDPRRPRRRFLRPPTADCEGSKPRDAHLCGDGGDQARRNARRQGDKNATIENLQKRIYHTLHPVDLPRSWRCALPSFLIEDAYGDVPPPPPFVEGSTSLEVRWRLCPLSEADGIGENLKVFEWI